MTIEKALITPAESQVILALEADWIALDDATQAYHIAFASTYIQLMWDCGDSVDWSVVADLPAEVKEACAYYALANFRGTLYEDTTQKDITQTGKIAETTDKLGALSSTVKYCCDSRGGSNPLQYPDALMSYYCVLSRVSGGAGGVAILRT